MKANVTFSFDPENKVDYHDIYLSFSTKDDMTIWEFCELCKRFALAMGYVEASVNEAFGENCE